MKLTIFLLVFVKFYSCCLANNTTTCPAGYYFQDRLQAGCVPCQEENVAYLGPEITVRNRQHLVQSKYSVDQNCSSPKKEQKKANISMLMFFPLSYFIVVNDAQWAYQHKQVQPHFYTLCEMVALFHLNLCVLSE